MPGMAQLSLQPAPVATATSMPSSALSTKVSFSFSGSSTKPLLANSSALTRRSDEGSKHGGIVEGSAAVVVSDGSGTFQSLSTIASTSADPSAVPLVIPLKQTPSWRDKALATAAASAPPPASTASPVSSITAADGDRTSSAANIATSIPLTLQQQAEEQLLASANRFNDTTAAALPAELYSTLSIPLQQQTTQRTAQTFEPAPLLNAAAAVADEPRYVIPLEEYGVALLRGMGWKGPGDAVGRANKADVQPVLMKRREERMGLGADTAAKQNGQVLLPHQQARTNTNGDKAAVAAATEPSPAVSRPQSAATALRAKVGSRVLSLASQQLRVNSLIYVAAGRHRRQYGRVKEMTQRTKRVEDEGDHREEREAERRYKLEVQLNSGEYISVESNDVDVLDERALPDDHPAFGRVKREDEERRHNQPPDERRERDSQQSKKNEYDDRPDKRHKSSHPHTSLTTAPTLSSRSSPPARPASPSLSHSSGRPVWCAPHLRVRVVSRSMSSGSCFRCKARVVDVPAASAIELLLDDGRTVTASEQQLETVIPSEKGGAVQVVRGELRGQVGELIERDSKRGVAVVQLEDDLQVHTLDFDDICERVR